MCVCMVTLPTVWSFSWCAIASQKKQLVVKSAELAMCVISSGHYVAISVIAVTDMLYIAVFYIWPLPHLALNKCT